MIGLVLIAGLLLGGIYLLSARLLPDPEPIPVENDDNVHGGHV